MKAALLFVCLIAAVYASSHSEAPGTAKAPQSDVTDFYMFRSYEAGREDNIVFIMNANPLQNPYGGPNYFSLSDDHFYEIYVDNNGDGEEDITFQFYYGNTMGGEFGDVPFINDEDDCVLNQNPRLRSLNPKPLTIQKHKGITVNAGGQQTAVPLKFVGPVTAGDNSALNWNEWYYINYITGDRTYGRRRNITEAGTNNYQFTKPFDNAGDKTFPDYHNYAKQYIYDIDIPDCNRPGRVFVGQRKESFSVNLGGIFDLVNFVPVEGFVANDDRNNAIRDKNIDSFVLEVPIECLLDNSDVIGAWTGVRQLHHGGDAHIPGKQVSRLGNPLVNEVVIGLPDKGKFNLAEPFQDTMFGNYVLYPSMPELLNILFLDTVNSALSANYPTIAPTKFPRNDLAVAFLTGIPGLNAHPNRGNGLYEYLRLNTTIEPLSKGSQNQFGVLANDAAGYPNGRRPGDDVVDIALRCLMGVLCTLDNPDVFGCTSADANAGGLPFSDGAPVDDSYFDDSFPFLLDPLPGYVASQTIVPSS